MATSAQKYIAVALAFCILATPTFAATPEKHGIKVPSTISVDAIPVCFDFGCKSQEIVSLPLTRWSQIAEIFLPPADTARQERKQIAEAVGTMEALVGLYTPTHNDLAFGLPKDDSTNRPTGQLDCIDEAVNTTTYMHLFEKSGFLKHHTVIEQSYRRSLFIQHWAGQLEEQATGKHWSVDSWFYPNGYPPIIQQTSDWKDLSLLTWLKRKFKKNRK